MKKGSVARIIERSNSPTQNEKRGVKENIKNYKIRIRQGVIPAVAQNTTKIKDVQGDLLCSWCVCLCVVDDYKQVQQARQAIAQQEV